MVYTDGACSGNPGPGGYAAVLCEHNTYSVCGGNRHCTTNNRMELLAVMTGIMQACEKGYTVIEVYSDSAYVVNAIKDRWVDRWMKNGWKTSSGGVVKNQDCWEYLYKMLQNPKYKLKVMKVKGHSGNSFNELADKFARKQCEEAKRQLLKRKEAEYCPVFDESY